MTTKKNFSVNPNQSSSEFLLKDIRHNTKRIFTSEQKVLIGMEGIRREHSIAELCRKYGISDRFITNGKRILSRPAKLASMVIPFVKQQMTR